MGKKSKAAKAKAKAGAGDGSSGPKEGGGTGGGTSGDAMVTSNKRQNCVRCFGTVKADKGSACPGCSLLYCWRCEKKYFVPCPNGERRCYACVESHRLRKFLDSIDDEENDVFDEGADDNSSDLS